MIASLTQATRRLLACVAILAAAAAALPASGRADGDPASDVLSGTSLFLPPDAGASAHQLERLREVLQEAARSGYAVRVAVIASPADLGSVGALWRQPAAYARFLGEELSLVYGGRVLVVMPDGFGLYRPGAAAGAQEAVLAQVRHARGLAGVATAAVTRLAAATGHPVAVSAAPMPSAARSSSPGTDGAVLGVGAVLVVMAWAASLRARPPAWRRSHA